MDDILVTGTDDVDHLYNVEQVLSRLEETGLKAKRPKGQFFSQRWSTWATLWMNMVIALILKKPKPFEMLLRRRILLN